MGEKPGWLARGLQELLIAVVGFAGDNALDVSRKGSRHVEGSDDDKCPDKSQAARSEYGDD